MEGAAKSNVCKQLRSDYADFLHDMLASLLSKRDDPSTPAATSTRIDGEMIEVNKQIAYLNDHRSSTGNNEDLRGSGYYARFVTEKLRETVATQADPLRPVASLPSSAVLSWCLTRRWSPYRTNASK